MLLQREGIFTLIFLEKGQDNMSELPSNLMEQTQCYHCGGPCEEEHLRFDQRDFCCHGCQTVYDILKENDLGDYYNLEQNPGINLKPQDFEDQYAFLDHDEIQEKLLDFTDGKMSRVRLLLPAIHCSSCIWLLENLYKLKGGIRQSRVNFGKKQLMVEFSNEALSLRQLVETLVSIGYEPHISLEENDQQKKSSPDRTLFLKIGVAAFCFGNIMLLSFPEYFGFDGGWDDEYRRFFSWLNVFLSLPIIGFCSTDYFKSAYQGLKHRHINIDVPIAIGIVTLFVRSVLEVGFDWGSGYFDSLGGLLFFLLTGKWFQSKSYESLSFDRDYKSYFPLAINRKEDEQMKPVPVANLQVGDQIMVRNHEIIPADSVLTSVEANIDYSFVTGESEPVRKVQGEKIFAGGRQVGASIELVVKKPVSQSYLTQLWNQGKAMEDDAQDRRSMINQISKYFTVVVLLIAFASAGYWTLVDPSKILNAFTAVLIVACPCALTLATPFTLSAVLSVFGRQHFYLKNTASVENLASIDTLIFDKTGTITYSAKGKVEYKGKAISKDELSVLANMVQHSTHPLSRKLAEYMGEETTLALAQYQEFAGKGQSSVFEGKTYLLGSAKFTEADYVGATLSGASKVYVKIDGEFRGYFILHNQYRKGLKSLIDALKGHFSMALISGDNDSEAEQLREYFPKEVPLMFNQTPDQKRAFVEQKQQDGASVAMLGDGLNDAVALQQADFGIAVTDDIGAFTPACDAILDAEKLPMLQRLIRFSHTAKKIIIASFVISFAYNIIGLSFAVAGMLTPVLGAILMPVSSISVVAFATLSVQVLARRYRL
ncbi:ATPase [Persicobacter psychrovividus]|uniref:ATPase n=2 Tax=Persicobacter psychrovividus TaxID=387638 RepID=A0ABM7VH43_9BACT|nr:ATPase [Persicobacter psychrovividus]